LIGLQKKYNLFLFSQSTLLHALTLNVNKDIESHMTSSSKLLEVDDQAMADDIN